MINKSMCYVSFSRGASLASFFMKKGFSHCDVYRQRKHGYIVSGFDGYTEYHFFSRTLPRNALFLQLPDGYDIERFSSSRHKVYGGKYYPSFRLMTCVRHVKTLLSIKNPFIITPYQLYIFLKKRGAEEVKSDSI